MKRYPIKKSSSVGKIKKEIDALFRKTTLRDRGNKCEWCGKTHETVFVSHILPKGSHPALRYCKENVLLLCYFCHMHKWHKDTLLASEWLNSYKGKEYRYRLLGLEVIQPKHDKTYLNTLKFAYEEILKSQKEGILYEYHD